MKNLSSVLAPSAARIADATFVGPLNYESKGLILIIDVTAIVDTPSVVFTIQGVDPASGKTWTILASAAIVGTGTTVLRVYPGLTPAANLVASDIMPVQWQVLADHNDADSITYSLGAVLIG